MERVLALVDVILFDIKQLDAAQHQRTTGVGNATILANLRRAAAVRPVWLRVPLIAGFNDSADHIRSVALLGKGDRARGDIAVALSRGRAIQAKQPGPAL